MKQKRRAAASNKQDKRPPVAPAAPDQTFWQRRDTISVVLFSVLLFFAMTLQTGRMALILAVSAIALSIGKTPLKNLRAHLSVPVVGLLAFALMNGLAAIYSDFGSYAASEFYKLLASFSLAVILLARFEKKHTRGLLWGFGAVCAVIALLCIDLSSWGVLFSGFRAFMDFLGADYGAVVEAAQAGRANGIYGDANLTGALLGMAMLACLYLVHTGEKTRDKLPGSLLLGICSVSFLMAMSRGAILCFAAAALVYLAAAGKERRLELFFLMLSTVIALAAAGGVGLVSVSEGAFLPVLMAPACGLLIFVLDWGVGSRLAARLRGHGRAVLIVCCALVVLVMGAAAAAWNMTVPYVFEEDGYLYRSLRLEPGEYTLSGDWDGADTTRVTVYYQTKEDALLGKNPGLYNGPARDAAFTVPEGAQRVFFQFRGEDGDSIRRLTLSDGTGIPLTYRFIPEMIAYRLHSGLFTSNSFLLRVQFMKDGLKLFARSPLIGHGLGSTEGLLTSVQPFFYESLYIHSHLIQIMDETGLLGLAAFLTLALGSAWLLVRRLRQERDPLAAALLAVWVMMNAHSLMEINFSIRMYQCAAFLMLLLPVMLYAKPLSKKAAKWGGLAVSGFIWIYLAVFGWLLVSHRAVQRDAARFAAADAAEFMNAMRGFTNRDSFDHEQYQLNFVGNAVILGDDVYFSTMEKYVKELRASGTYTACSGLARYYYLPRGEYEELFACSREGIAQEASAAEAWNLQLDFYRGEVLPAAGTDNVAAFLDGVTALQNYLAEYSQGRLEEIRLSEENQAFLAAVSETVQSGAPADQAYLYLIGQLDTLE